MEESLVTNENEIQTPHAPLRGVISSEHLIDDISRALGRVIAIVAFLLGARNLYMGIITLWNICSRGWVQSGAISVFDFWIIYPLISGAVIAVLAVVLLVRSFLKNKEALTQKWLMAVSVLLIVAMILQPFILQYVWFCCFSA